MSDAVAVSAPAAPATPAAPAVGDAAPVAANDSASPAATVETPAAAQPAAEAAKPSEAAPVESPKPATPAVDEVAETLARLNRAERDAVKEKKRLAAEREQFAGKLSIAERAEKARQALAAKDYIGALAALSDDALNVDEAAVLMMEQANARDPKPMTEADVARIAAEQLKAEKEAAAKAAEAKQAKALEDSKALYGNACVAAFKASPDKYPLVAALGVKGDDLIAYAMEEAQKTGAAPDPAAALEHFEGRIEAAMRKAGYSKAQIQATKDGEQTSKPAPTAPTPDMRGSAPDPKKAEKVETMAEMEARHKAEFRALRQQQRA